MAATKSPVVVTAIPNGFKISVTGTVQTKPDSLDQALQRVADEKPKRVELDLAGASFISTVGLAALIAFRNQIVKQGGALEVTAIHDQTLSIFRFTHLYKLFPIGTGAVINNPETKK